MDCIGNRNIFKYLENHIQVKESLLDIGCGELQEEPEDTLKDVFDFDQSGFDEIHGFDANPPTVEQCRAHYRKYK